MTPGAKLSTIQQHYAPADNRKCVLELEVVEDRARRNNVLEKSAESSDVPLAVAQLVDQLVFGFQRRNVKGFVESAIGTLYAEVCVEVDAERFVALMLERLVA